MEEIKIWNNSLSGKQAQEIADRLEGGEIMIYPTDTLYAIGCDALNLKAIEKICRLMGIKTDKTNLSIICKDISQAAEYARIDNSGFQLMRQYTPGPVTFIFRAASSLPRAFKGRKEVGVRIPDCPAPVQIVEALGHPILTTTVKFEDEDYTQNPELIAEHYENQPEIDFILLGDDCETTPSTIVDCTTSTPTLIRPGRQPLDL